MGQPSNLDHTVSQLADLHKSLREGQQKLNYFLLGLAAAMFAYLGKDFRVHALALNRETVELAALLCFAASVAIGVLVVSASLTIQQWNIALLQSHREHLEFTGALQSGQAHLDVNTGETVTHAQLTERIEHLLGSSKDLNKRLEAAVRYATELGLARTGTLLVGFGLLALSRAIG
jgi:hypothetical protein